MAASLSMISSTGPSALQQQRYHDEGYVILPGLLTPEAVERIRNDVLDIMQAIGLGLSKLRQTSEYLRGSALDSLVNSTELRSVAEALLGGDATVYLPFTAVKSGGGGGQFHFHQDNQYTRFDGPGVNLWIALSPMTVENGCLRVVPRSHLNGTLPFEASGDGDEHKKVQFEPTEFVPALMSPGDCIAFSRLTVHGSGPNQSDHDRVAYAVQFHRNDVNYSTDGGESYRSLLEKPRWRVSPVDVITPPTGKTDGH